MAMANSHVACACPMQIDFALYWCTEKFTGCMAVHFTDQCTETWWMHAQLSEFVHYMRTCLARRKQLVSLKKIHASLANQIAGILRPILWQVKYIQDPEIVWCSAHINFTFSISELSQEIVTHIALHPMQCSWSKLSLYKVLLCHMFHKLYARGWGGGH